MDRRQRDEIRVFAPEQLRDMAGGDEELMRELVDLYTGHAEIEWPMLVGAVREEEWEQVRQLAHALKGSSMTIGAETAARHLQLIEESARGRTSDGLREAVESAQGAYVSACRKMRQMLAAA
ncbi:MAG: Hpt domain-containing protein [Planctomycetota bacterium]|nr:Hpt domain-containing protein [Planctomycetota bacterium]